APAPGPADAGLGRAPRRRYLTPAERAEAPALYQALLSIRERIGAGERDLDAIERECAQALAARGWQVDYLAVRRQRDLQSPAPADLDAGEPLVALAAAKLGATRLIDNLEL